MVKALALQSSQAPPRCAATAASRSRAREAARGGRGPWRLWTEFGKWSSVVVIVVVVEIIIVVAVVLIVVEVVVVQAPGLTHITW